MWRVLINRGALYFGTEFYNLVSSKIRILYFFRYAPLISRTMAGQIGIAISDLVLAIVAFHSAYCLSTKFIWAVAGFLLVGLAASFGVFKFGLERPSPTLTRAHSTASWIAKLIGMSLISTSYQLTTTADNGTAAYAYTLFIASVVTAMLSDFLPRQFSTTATDAIGGIAILTILGKSVTSWNVCGMVGALGYTLGGIVVEWNVGRQLLSPITTFHYIIALANVLLRFGLEQS